MTDGLDVPKVRQDSYHAEQLAAVVLDLGVRAEVFDQLMASARGFRHQDDRLHPDLDAKAWFAAVEVAITPRPKDATS